MLFGSNAMSPLTVVRCRVAYTGRRHYGEGDGDGERCSDCAVHPIWSDTQIYLSQGLSPGPTPACHGV